MPSYVIFTLRVENVLTPHGLITLITGDLREGVWSGLEEVGTKVVCSCDDNLKVQYNSIVD